MCQALICISQLFKYLCIKQTLGIVLVYEIKKEKYNTSYYSASSSIVIFMLVVLTSNCKSLFHVSVSLSNKGGILCLFQQNVNTKWSNNLKCCFPHIYWKKKKWKGVVLSVRDGLSDHVSGLTKHINPNIFLRAECLSHSRWRRLQTNSGSVFHELQAE